MTVRKLFSRLARKLPGQGGGAGAMNATDAALPALAGDRDSGPLEFDIYGADESKKPVARVNPLIFHHMSCTGGVAFSQTVMRFGMAGYNSINFVPTSSAEMSDWANLLVRSGDAGRLYLHGHWVNGVHSLLGSSSGAYFTLLRNPVDRFLSEFFWERRNDPRSASAPWQLIPDLAGWMDALGEAGHANFYCAEIAVPQLEKALFHSHLRRENMAQFSAEDVYRMASAKLESSYFFVGISELFEESLMDLFRMMGWTKIGPWARGPHAPGRGASSRKFGVSDLPMSVQRKLRKLIAADIELYETWRGSFEDRLRDAPLLGELDRYKRYGWSR